MYTNLLMFAMRFSPTLWHLSTDHLSDVKIPTGCGLVMHIQMFLTVHNNSCAFSAHLPATEATTYMCFNLCSKYLVVPQQQMIKGR